MSTKTVRHTHFIVMLNTFICIYFYKLLTVLFLLPKFKQFSKHIHFQVDKTTAHNLCGLQHWHAKEKVIHTNNKRELTVFTVFEQVHFAVRHIWDAKRLLTFV